MPSRRGRGCTISFLVVVSMLGLCETSAFGSTANASSIKALQRALQDPSILTVNLFTSLRLASPAWAHVAVDHSVTIVGALPGVVLDLDLRGEPVISTTTGGRLQLRNLILVNFTGQGAAAAGGAVDQLTGAIDFVECVFLTSNRHAFGLLPDFQSADPVPAKPGDKKLAFTANVTTSDGSQNFVNSTVIIDPGCSSYTGGVVVFSSASLLSGLQSGASKLYLVNNLTLSIADFTVGAISIDRPVKLYSCPATMLDLNSIRATIAVMPGGSVTMQDVSISSSFAALFSNSTPPGNSLFLGAFKLVNSSLALVNSTIVTSSKNQVQPLGKLLASYPWAVKPDFSVDPDGKITIPSWRLRQRDWEASQGRPSVSTSSWVFRGVHVVSMNSACFADYPGIQVRNDQQLLKALQDAVISHIQIINDIVFNPANWPPEASGPNNKGITINRTIDIRACHPAGGRYLLDFANIGQIIFVYGHVRFLGDLQVIHSKPAVRRSFLYVLISALSVEKDGTIEFENVTINGTKPSPLHDASDGIWGYQSKVANIVPSPGTYTNVSYHTILLDDYVFDKALWVRLSQGLVTTGKGYWRFTSVTLQWWPAPPHKHRRRQVIVLPCVIGGVLLLAGVAAVLVARRKGWRPQALLQKGAAPPQDPPPMPAKMMGLSESDDLGSAAGGVALAAAAENLGSDPKPSGSPRDLAEERIEEARRGLKASARQDQDQHLVLEELLGEGSFGRVYRGHWRGTLVAVKTMLLPPGLSGKEKREKMAIMEAAISSSLSHPNVVQTYTYIIKQLPQPPLRSASEEHAAGTIQFMPPDVPAGEVTHPVAGDSSRPWLAGDVGWEVRLVQEYCDRGSLRDALDRGALRGPGGGADMLQVVETALDVAHAMVHLHDQHILHSDLKARNILLKSSATDARGFAAKVADFGLSLQIPATDTHISNFYQGTMTHMAPEVLLSGKLSRASDVYAFAVLLWELYTAEHAFRGVPRAYLGHEVARLNKRPELPGSCPFEYRLLVYRCWESDAAIRPTFHQIVEQLKHMKAGLQGPHTSNASKTIPTQSPHPTVTRPEHSSISSSASALGSTSSAPALPLSPTPMPTPPQPASAPAATPRSPPAHTRYGPTSWDSTAATPPPGNPALAAPTAICSRADTSQQPPTPTANTNVSPDATLVPAAPTNSPAQVPARAFVQGSAVAPTSVVRSPGFPQVRLANPPTDDSSPDALSLTGEF